MNNLKIAILDTNLSYLCMAHEILDNIDTEIHFFTESAEIGMYGEKPGLIDNWPIINPNWLGSIFSQEPILDSSAIRYSWFCKAISISLANRNCFFHLRTKIEKIRLNNIDFVGAGFLGSGTLMFDHIIHTNPPKSSKIWFGGTTVDSSVNIDNSISGRRPDSILEIWSANELPSEINWLQLMQWKGTNPKKSIHSEIHMGSKRAQEFLQSNAFLKKSW
jgi:hypothetical protein